MLQKTQELVLEPKIGFKQLSFMMKLAAIGGLVMLIYFVLNFIGGFIGGYLQGYFGY